MMMMKRVRVKYDIPVLTKIIIIIIIIVCVRALAGIIYFTYNLHKQRLKQY